MAKKETNLAEFLIKNSNSKFTSKISESKVFNREVLECPTDIPVLNIALSGKAKGGLRGGVLTLAGESKRFKTLFGLYLIKAFQNKYPDGICMFYDTELGSPPDYLELFGLDTSRIVWTPIPSVEEMKIELNQQLDNLKKLNDPNARVMIFIDSIGQMASKKEIADALDGKIKVDMSRAKGLKSFWRTVTLNIKLLDIPLVNINHTYKTQDFIPTDIVGGGQGGELAADNVWIIGKRMIKDGKELLGHQFVIRVNKSRYIREKTSIPIDVYYDEGIRKYSGLAELALDLGVVNATKIGNSKALEFKNKTIKEKDNDLNSEFWENVIENSNLMEMIERKYALINKKKMKKEK